MNQESINEETTIPELAVIVSKHLESNNVMAVLSGGSVVTIYTDNKYESGDLDFISPELHKSLLEIMAKIGFVPCTPSNKNLCHPKTKLKVEFPSGPLSFGGKPVRYDEIEKQEVEGESIRILSPTYSVIDRLLIYLADRDPQGLDQAQWICERHPVNLEKIKSWARSDGRADEEEYKKICQRCENAIRKFNSINSK
jgi:hypothetical protein